MLLHILIAAETNEDVNLLILHHSSVYLCIR